MIEMTRERYLKYEEIYKRAEKKYPELRKGKGSNLMDIESADELFNLRLDDWLAADDLDFFHDFFGIINESNRETFPCTFGLFVPRFAGKKGE